MTRWDALTILGGVTLAGGAWWIYPPAAVILLGTACVWLGMAMDRNRDRKQDRRR